MTRYSFHASQEQFSPADLLGLAERAEGAGFDGVFSSDHAHPWSESQGECGFTWSWLGAALARTRRMTFGTITVPGGWRYHPALLAQAVATLGVMFPGRVPWIALGSGQFLNEHVTGESWPDKHERNARLRQGAEAMRRLLDGECVVQRGAVPAVDAKVWSRPAEATKLFGGATTPETARFVGAWADGLLTVCPDHGTLCEVLTAFREGGGAGKPTALKVDVSWAPTEAEALAQAHGQWRFNVLGHQVNWDIRMPKDFDHATRFVRPEDMRDVVCIATDPARLADWIAQRAALGFETINIHNVGTNQAAFLDMAERELLPRLR